MDFINEYTMRLSVDRRTKAATAYLTVEDGAGQRWVADHSFGPFETPLEVSTWLARALVRDDCAMTR